MAALGLGRAEAGSQSVNVLDRILTRAVIFNGVLLPQRAMHGILIKYVDHLLELNDSEDWPFSLVGSGVPLSYQGRNLVVCCRHQLKGRDLARVGLFAETPKHIVTSGRSIEFNRSGDSDLFDLALFDFTEPCAAGALHPARFHTLLAVPPDTPSDRIVFVLCVGFPYSDQRYELDALYFGSGRRVVVCQPQRQSADPALLKVAATKPLEFNPDGMSGGSAFVCLENDGQLEIFFAGVISRGGRDGFHIIKAGHVRNFLDFALTPDGENDGSH